MKEPIFPPPGKRSYTKEPPRNGEVQNGEPAASRWVVGGNWYATRIYLASIRGLSQVPHPLTYLQFRTSMIKAAGLGLIILRAQP